MIGRQLEEMWQVMGKGKFTVVEFCAGTGALCKSTLGYVEYNKEFYNQLDYCIIEKSKENLTLREKASWENNINNLQKIDGCILSNELLDNFPVHQVIMQNELMEVFVGYENGFFELLKPAPEALKEHLQKLNIALPESFRTEINLNAVEWVNQIASNLNKGFVLTIDYGFLSPELYACSRSRYK